MGSYFGSKYFASGAPATPPSPPPAPVIAGYFAQLSDADAMALTLLNIDSFKGASNADRTAALNQGADEIDRGMRFQGRKYLFDQDREFPRVAFESSRRTMLAVGPVGPIGVGMGETIWDWDDTNKVAVVPTFVFNANIIQADSILAGTRSDRLDAQHDGVADQMTGPMRETYNQKSPTAQQPLCRRAYQLLLRYQLKGGRIL